ncbi:hypothetical protein MNEG_13756, partial [Monoraphidium neglectum]
MQSLRGNRILSAGIINRHHAGAPSRCVGPPARQQQPSWANPRLAGSLIGRMGDHISSVVATATSNGTSGQSDSVYIPVDELRELVSQSLSALGYTNEEIKTLRE